MNPLVSSVYPEDDPFRVPFPKEPLKVAQDQYRNNEEARAARVQEVLSPFLGDPNSQTDLVSLFVEHPNLENDALADALGLDITEVMEQVWQARPISMFSCLVPSCRAPIPVRNRKHLIQLLRLEKYFGLWIEAGDLVEFKKLAMMLCESCVQGLQHLHDEQHRANLIIRQARIAQLRKMPFSEYQLTPEWRSLRNRVILRAGNRCELCYESGQLEVHHRTYERYGQELLSDLVALCRSCHRRVHGIQPEAA